MLTEGLYHIEKKEVAATGEINCEMRLNAHHPVFEGHFPGRPILPGVLMVQMIHELAEQVTGKKLRMVQAKKIKFLSAVDPTQGNLLLVKLLMNNEDGNYSADASAVFMNQACFKINARYTIE